MELVTLDSRYGGNDVYQLATRAFRSAHRKVGGGAYAHAIERDLEAAVGEMGEVAAWIAYGGPDPALDALDRAEAVLSGGVNARDPGPGGWSRPKSPGIGAAFTPSWASGRPPSSCAEQTSGATTTLADATGELRRILAA